jgi:hypothetical protein
MKMCEMKNREELQAAWEEIVDLGFSRYRHLNRTQRVWFNIEPLTTDGLWDHYVNGGGKHNRETIEDLILLGFPNVAQLLRRLNKLFPPLILGSVWRVSICINWWPDGKNETIIDEVEEEFWAIEPNLSEALLAYLNQNEHQLPI